MKFTVVIRQAKLGELFLLMRYYGVEPSRTWQRHVSGLTVAEILMQDLADSVNDMSKGNDWFLVANDFASYMDAQEEVDRVYKDQDEWLRRSIKMTASSGFFLFDQYPRNTIPN